jgi:DedD protein
MDDEQEVEATAGTGRLLSLFLGMVVLCAVFFGLGYSLGKTAVPATAQAAEPLPAAAATTGAAKPSPLNPDGSGAQAQPPSADQLTFYKSVGQKDQQPGLAAKPAPAEAKPEAVSPAATEEAKLAVAVGMTPVTATAPAAGYTVQIAAVRHQEDADALVKALRKKHYPVFVPGDAPDKLFHIQVGPFTDPKEAEAMKARLEADGYKPIVKK